MSPELKTIANGYTSVINFNPEKSDIFSLGISVLRAVLLLEES